MRINVEVIGTLQVTNYLGRAENFNSRRAFTRAGLAVESSARLKAPVRTGHLRRNIISTATDTEAEIGVDLNVVPYAWYQEAGTSRMQAHPYLRPALESQKPAIIAIFEDELNKAIKGGTL